MKVKYKELKDWHVNNDDAKALAKKVFGDRQPNIYQTGFYSAPNWNWGYVIGITIVDGKTYEVVTQFGAVVSARLIQIPEEA